MIEKIKSIANNEKWIETLFVLMILSFPFGSFFLSFSIGFMTVYPYLVLLCILTFLGFFKSKKIDTKLEKFFLYFLILFFIYALAFLPFVDGKKDAIIDLRSIILMVMTSFVFISVSKVLGFEKWKTNILFSFKLIFFFVLVFCVFEILTGFHFSGEFTEKIIERGLKDNYSITPVFLWDNPNNLCVYLFLIGTVIILLEPKSKQKSILNWLIILTWFLISFITLSRIGIAITLMLAVFCGTYQLVKFVQKKSTGMKKNMTYVLFVIFTMAIIFVTKEKFYGIPLEKEKIYRSTILKTDQLNNQEGLVIKTPENKDTLVLVLGDIPEVKVPPPVARNSNSERKGLIQNGIDFIFASKFLGVGPGQYRYLHDSNQIKYNTFGNNGPHFWFLELVSQYGVIIFLLYCFFLFWIFISAIKGWKMDSELALNIVFALFCFGAVSLMPSGFLILDMNWIFIAILVAVSANFSKLNSEKADV